MSGLASRLKSLALAVCGAFCVAFGVSEFSHKPHHVVWLILDLAGGGIIGAVATWRPS